jgi:hypothetical protein
MLSQVGLEEAKAFQEDYAEMFESFDADVFELLSAWLRNNLSPAEMKESDPDSFRFHFERGFAELVQRKAIAPARPFSAEGQKQFDVLTKIYHIPTAAELAERAARPKPDPFADVVADFNGRISTPEFKKRCQTDPAYFKKYEDAIRAGRL